MKRKNLLTFVIALFVLFVGISGCLDSQADSADTQIKNAQSDDVQIGDLQEDSPQMDNDILFQTSTIAALLEGVYDGDMTFKELKKHGDFGIGTFNALDGEMLELDGIVYQIKSDGVAYPVDDSAYTPFAVVTSFENDRDIQLTESMNNTQLMEYLDSIMVTKNIIYAFKIEGDFDYMKTRSVPKQTKPYPRLTEVTKNQPTFEFNDVTGTMIGFWLPDYVKGMNLGGYHFHFITEDRAAGGHVLEYQLDNAIVEIDYTYNLFLELPKNDAFYSVDLTEDKQAELEQAEK